MVDFSSWVSKEALERANQSRNAQVSAAGKCRQGEAWLNIANGILERPILFGVSTAGVAVVATAFWIGWSSLIDTIASALR